MGVLRVALREVKDKMDDEIKLAGLEALGRRSLRSI